MRNYRKRTESNEPFTIQQVEDVMFIDEKNLVSLEMIYYSTNLEGAHYTEIVRTQDPGLLNVKDFFEDSKRDNINFDYRCQPLMFKNEERDYINKLMTDDTIENDIMETSDGDA